MDLGIQMLDLALWLLGYPPPERVSAHSHAEIGSDVDDAAALMLRLAGDRLVGLEVASNLHAERDRQFLHLTGSSGSASLSPLAVFKEMESGLVNVTPPLPPGRENLFTASYRQELQYFVDVVRGDREAAPPREHALLMRIMAAAHRSAEERREIEL
jgi:predicted dehydrogenase